MCFELVDLDREPVHGHYQAPNECKQSVDPLSVVCCGGGAEGVAFKEGLVHPCTAFQRFAKLLMQVGLTEPMRGG